MSYDPQCYELAQHFAPDGYSEAHLDELAQVIQDAIEAHLLRCPDCGSLNPPSRGNIWVGDGNKLQCCHSFHDAKPTNVEEDASMPKIAAKD